MWASLRGPGVAQKEGLRRGMELAVSGERVVRIAHAVVGHDHVVQTLDAEQRAAGDEPLRIRCGCAAFRVYTRQRGRGVCRCSLSVGRRAAVRDAPPRRVSTQRGADRFCRAFAVGAGDVVVGDEAQDAGIHGHG